MSSARRIIDNDGGFTQYSVVIGIDNVAPVVDAGADTTVFPNTVLNHVVNFTDPGTFSLSTSESILAMTMMPGEGMGCPSWR